MVVKRQIPNRNGEHQIFSIDEKEDHVVLVRYLSTDIKEVDIPSIIDAKPVTHIAGDCFFNHPEICDVRFPDTVTFIGMQAFALCKGIKELLLPDSVTEIEELAFRDCTGLRKIVLPASLKVLRRGVFCFCYLPDDVEIVLNEGLETIEGGVFSSGGINNFFTLKIPDSMQNIAKEAFSPGMKIITSRPINEDWFI